jgi:RNA recognition motif-containing protein
MGRNLYVGNLAYGITNPDLEHIFGRYGAVRSAMVIMDRETGRSKGFGFVEMGTDQEARAAVAVLNGKDVEGRTLTVREATPRPGPGGPAGPRPAAGQRFPAGPGARGGKGRPPGPGAGKGRPPGGPWSGKPGPPPPPRRKRPPALGSRLRKPPPGKAGEGGGAAGGETTS